MDVLLVEDNPGDVQLTLDALADNGISGEHVSVARDGQDAMELLSGRGGAEDDAGAGPFRPDLILLDLRLPRMDGMDVLEEVKQDPALRRIPVVVLTTSDADRDVAEAYDRGANWYVVKPVELADFEAAVHQIRDMCRSIVRLPPRPNG